MFRFLATALLALATLMGATAAQAAAQVVPVYRMILPDNVDYLTGKTTVKPAEGGCFTLLYNEVHHGHLDSSGDCAGVGRYPVFLGGNEHNLFTVESANMTVVVKVVPGHGMFVDHYIEYPEGKP